jgi:hypothetical protein
MSTQVVVENYEVTSEIASEVQLAPQAELNVLITFGAVYKSFNQSLTPVVKVAAIKVKAAFGVRQGFAGKTLMVEGHEMEWSMFVKKYFGITPRRFNQILELEDEAAGEPKPKATKAPKVAPADDATLPEKFDDLDQRLHAAEEENVKLRAELEQVRSEVDPVEMLVGIWRSFEPRQVQTQLRQIIDALDLTGYLRIEIDEIQ